MVEGSLGIDVTSPVSVNNAHPVVPEVKHRYWQAIWYVLVALFVFIGVRPHAESPPPGNADLFGHAIINLVLGLVASKGFMFPRAYVIALLGLAVVGASIELLQSFSPNRESAISDLVANFAGIFIAFAIICLVRSKRRGGRV